MRGHSMVVDRTRMLGALAGLLGGALLVAGCGQQPASSPSPAPGSSSASPAPGIAVGDSPVQAANPTSGQQAGGGSCTAKDFKVDLNVQPDRPGILLMAVENTSKKVCKLNGWAAVAPMDASGSTFNVPTKKVEIPGSPTQVDLPPGTNAFAGVRIELGSKADDRVATGFDVTLPGVSDPVNGNIVGTDGTDSNSGLYAEFPVKSMQVGTLQPAAQGVTVFD
ncbi:DUF4232 domain-containing protein [Amycolatopsis taiwanensis]|nr:DUF4232 domain-containing protein [Amycolatopsis taiwanensis]